MIKKTIALVAVGAALLPLAACGPEKQEAAEVELTTLDQKVSYILGTNIGTSFKGQDINLDVDALALALRDVYSENPSRLSEEDMQAAMETFQSQQQEKMAAMQAEQAAEQAAAGDANAKEGAEFLAANKEKEGVVTLESGLQYKVIEEGTGAKPSAADTVTVHYRGTLLDGTEFDSSYSRNQPATFPLNRVIPGWTEGLQQMAEGGKYELYIPGDLAYGAAGGGAQIGPNATLIFEIELLEIAKQEEAAAPAAE
ncbi:macrophage infectivity potentiator Mip [Aurantivibrio plasticivorans]